MSWREFLELSLTISSLSCISVLWFLDWRKSHMSPWKDEAPKQAPGASFNQSHLGEILSRIPPSELCQALLQVFVLQDNTISPAPGEIMCAIGLGSTLVRSGESSNVNVRPPKPFRLDRLIIPSSLGSDFLVTDIKVMGESQFDSPGAIPGLAFAECSPSIRFRGDVASPHSFITVSVANQHASPQNFQGVLIGRINSHFKGLDPESKICQELEAR
jgi:hypothetical protein